MKKLCLAVGALLLVPAYALANVVAKPTILQSEIVTGMPMGDQQQISLLTATLLPGAKTVFHTHRFPVTVFILSGAFTLEMEGREPVTISAGQSMVEPANVRMTGYNRSATEPMNVVIFYVSEPGMPFLDPVDQ